MDVGEQTGGAGGGLRGSEPAWTPEKPQNEILGGSHQWE